MIETVNWIYYWLVGLTLCFAAYVPVVIYRSKIYQGNIVIIAAATELTRLAQTASDRNLSPRPEDVMRLLANYNFSKFKMVTTIELSAKQMHQNGMDEQLVRANAEAFANIVNAYY
ncbi:MAG: hypothetical protein HRU29_06055 [Rhizobiales bacterium]|nr:hypothetical protein [Hyphomicrobiales bacterium]NRB13949.1 hypothetical protein [Hyphomicrobiales bacterium]